MKTYNLDQCLIIYFKQSLVNDLSSKKKTNFLL